MTKNIVIIGANSAISEAVARHYASEKHQLFLVARDKDKLDIICKDLEIRSGHAIATYSCDFADFGDYDDLVANIKTTMPQIDIVLIAHGILPDQQQCEQSDDALLNLVRINQTSVMRLCNRFATLMEQQGHGNLAVIGSVAGERGRKGIYCYGATKAAIDIYLQGLRNKLFNKDVHVTTILPGFIDTPMTKAYKKGVLWATAEAIAPSIVSAISKNKSIVYTPWYWRYIMLIIKLIPECLFKRMSI